MAFLVISSCSHDFFVTSFYIISNIKWYFSVNITHMLTMTFHGMILLTVTSTNAEYGEGKHSLIANGDWLS